MPALRSASDHGRELLRQLWRTKERPAISASTGASGGVTSGKASASLILGITGFVIILGVMAKRDIASRVGLGGSGMATAGIVLGITGIVVAALLAFMIVLALGTMSHSG